MLHTLRTQATISKRVEFCGIGVHSNIAAKLSISPASENTGIVFKRVDIHGKNNIIELKPKNVIEPVMCTKITNSQGISVSVIEHLVAAFRICGITNALIEIDTEEVPIMDGSAAVFLEEFSKTGITTQHAKVKAILIQSELSVQSNNGYISATPAIDQNIYLSLNYDRINKVIGHNNFVSFSMSDRSKLRSIAAARTFGWLEDCQKVRAMGMAKGTSLDNTVVITHENSIMNENGLRNKYEIVYHKALDLIGDFNLIDYDIIGSIKGVNTSHMQNNLFMRKLMSEIHLHTIVQNNSELQYTIHNKKQAFEDQLQLVC